MITTNSSTDDEQAQRDVKEHPAAPTCPFDHGAQLPFCLSSRRRPGSTVVQCCELLKTAPQACTVPNDRDAAEWIPAFAGMRPSADTSSCRPQTVSTRRM